MIETRVVSGLGVDVSHIDRLGADFVVGDIGAVRMEAIATEPPQIKVEFLDNGDLVPVRIIGDSMISNIDAIYSRETSEILARFAVSAAEGIEQ